MSVRAFKRRKWVAFAVSLFVLGAAAWLPVSLMAQAIPGNPNTPGGGAGVSWPISDETFKVADNGDATKIVEFELTGVTTANTVPITITGTAANPTIQFGTSFWQMNVGAVGAGIAVGGAAPGLGVGTGTLYGGSSIQGTDVGWTRGGAAATWKATDGSTGWGQVRMGSVAYGNRTTITVNGATTFAVNSSYSVLECTGAETINTITGGTAGFVLYLENSDTECTIADDDSATAADAVDLTGTATNDVGAVAKVITLIYNGSHWLQTAESDN